MCETGSLLCWGLTGYFRLATHESPEIYALASQHWDSKLELSFFLSGFWGMNLGRTCTGISLPSGLFPWLPGISCVLLRVISSTQASKVL